MTPTRRHGFGDDRNTTQITPEVYCNRKYGFVEECDVCRYEFKKKKARAGEIRLIFWIFAPSDNPSKLQTQTSILNTREVSSQGALSLKTYALSNVHQPNLLLILGPTSYPFILTLSGRDSPSSLYKVSSPREAYHHAVFRTYSTGPSYLCLALSR